MEIKDYCKNVEVELSQWHHKFSEIVNKMDSMPTSTKQQFFDEINGLQIIMTEMGDRIDRLRNECSIAWEPEKDEATPTIAGASKRFNDNADLYVDYDYGG